MEEVILVDKNDSQIGTEEKLKAHKEGKLHRAFSVYIFNSKGEFLLQQRALDKYHCGGLWTNTCCSHPRPGEPVFQAATRRLEEEMGLIAPLKKIFTTIYKAPFPNGLTEHEFLHVFIGTSDATPLLNKEEAAAYKWINIYELKQDMKQNPESYTYWFKICFDRVLQERDKLLKQR